MKTLSPLNVRMRGDAIRIQIALSRGRLLAVLIVLGTAVLASRLEPESVILSTSYPLPAAVYTSLVATDQSTLARDAGDVAVGGAGNPGANLLVYGDVGVSSGTAPDRLDVGGNARINGNLTVSNTLTLPAGAAANYVLTALNAAGTAVWATPSGGTTLSGGYVGSCGGNCKCNKGETIMTIESGSLSNNWNIANQGSAAVSGSCAGCTFACFR